MTAMAQEVCRRRNLPLDNLVRAGRVVNAITTNDDGSPIDGCYLTGLSLEGCTWDSDHMRLKDYVDKKIYTPIPLLSVQPMTSESANEMFKPAEAFYRCPIYTKPRRTAANCVFDVKLPFDPATKQAHWILRGVALLCSTE
jgi:dynein heavy chain